MSNCNIVTTSPSSSLITLHRFCTFILRASNSSSHCQQHVDDSNGKNRAHGQLDWRKSHCIRVGRRHPWQPCRRTSFRSRVNPRWRLWVDNRLCMFSHHLHDQWLERILGSFADSYLPNRSKTRIDNLVIFCWLPQYRSLCRPWARLCPIVANDRCTLQYVAGSIPDEFRQFV